MSSRKEQQEFVSVISQEVGVGGVDLAYQLMAIARRMERRNVQACNWGLTPRQEANDARDEALAESLVAPFGLRVITQGDPRGYALKVLLPSGRCNTWGGAASGWGVPVSSR